MTLRLIVRSLGYDVFGAINWSRPCKGEGGTLSRTHETAESPPPARNLKQPARRPEDILGRCEDNDAENGAFV